MDIEFFDFEIFDLDQSEDAKLSGPENAEVMLVMEEGDFEAHNTLISKIMAAVNYDINTQIRVCLLRQAQKVNIAQLVSSPSVRVIVFGLNPKQISMNASFKAYHLYKTESFEIMLSHSLDSLSTNKQFKKALWDALQNAFLNNG